MWIQASLTQADGFSCKWYWEQFTVWYLEFVWFFSKKYWVYTKIGHINTNSITGFKFHGIRSWLLSERFDILLITETKIDAGFGNGQFNVDDDFHMHYVNRDIHGGGLMIFLRNDICFHVITCFNMDLSSFCIKSTMLKVKINRSWFALAGIHKPRF